MAIFQKLVRMRGMPKDCSFCSSQEIKDRTITKTDLVRVFPTNIPIVPGHILITSIRHVQTINELTIEEREAIFALIATLRTALQKIFGAEGFNFAWNEGELAGQSIPHVHLHMLPRKPGDGGITKYEPRDFLYRPGSREVSPEAELADVVSLIQKAL